MLNLKRVELHGFKSFADRTELRFNGSGIAAIVGPNGCGKSNLADAVNWVLGEQSAKSLRGARMEDVIFAGTRDRKPVGMASVTLTLVDPEAHAPNGNGSPHANGTSGTNGSSAERRDEITVTRRLYRSGDSEYLIDGRPARLRDIQDIFMGTGLGPEHYAIIEQGRIGQILSSKPQDRRAVIEEAAGVSRFKTKRRLAEAKLEGAKHNLERVFDILEEVGRQASSLKRQAAKARRYQELRAEMAAQLRRALGGRFLILEREAAKTALDLNLATADVQSLARRVDEKDQEHTACQAECYRIEAELTATRQRLAELNLELERTRSRLDYQARQVAATEQRLALGESEARELETRAGAIELEIEAHSGRLSELEQQTESARERLKAKDEERERLHHALREREQSIEAARQQVLQLLGESSTLKNQLAQLDGYLASIDRDTARADKEEQGATADLARLGALKKELSEKLGASQLELESLAEQRRRIEADLDDRRRRATETRRQLDQLRDALAQIRARKDSLEEILSHRAYTTESVKRLFTAIENGQADGLKPLGVLADFVEVDPAYEKAAEEFLHDELEYVVVGDWSQAERGIELLRANLDGRATFLVHPENANGSGPPAAPEGVSVRLSDLLKLTNGFTSAPFECLPRLARCYLVEDRATAQRLAVAHPELHFLLPDGVCYHGRAVSGGKKTGSGPLALKRELRELKTAVSGRQRELDQAAARLAALEREAGVLAEELERLRSAQENREKEAVALDHEMRKLAEELARHNSRLSVARLELERLRKERARAEEQRANNEALVDAKEAARSKQEQALEAARVEIESLKTQAAAIAEEHSALRVELAGLEERWRAERAVAARLETQSRELANRRRDLAAEMEHLGAERARLLADNVELDVRIQTLVSEIGQTEAAVAALAGRESDLRTRLASLDDLLRQLRGEVQAAQEKRSQIELELVRRQSELKFLDETSRKELNTTIEELAQADEVPPDAGGVAEAEQRCQELRQKIEALGPVNPEALEQFKETQQRYEFLNTQRQDLLDSIRDTEKAIQEIDTESRRRFKEAFEAINNSFREVFRTLFGGGTGEMRLTDENNIAESGIEMVASPPGKRLQNVLLLSGGEKALTALALLVAIFQYQPSPFCILDEVDAPLDEPNIQRLTRLLKEMSARTQLILITHAKRTMEAAESLYGVTMQEPGVSKLVSVKLQPPSTPAIATI